MIIQIGGIVRTNYGTGPHIIREISEPCTCADYLRHIDGDDSPSEPHHHLTCFDTDSAARDKTSYLEGYRLDGTSVWDDDRLIFEGVERGTTLDLFGAVA